MKLCSNHECSMNQRRNTNWFRLAYVGPEISKNAHKLDYQSLVLICFYGCDLVRFWLILVFAVNEYIKTHTSKRAWSKIKFDGYQIWHSWHYWKCDNNLTNIYYSDYLTWFIGNYVSAVDTAHMNTFFVLISSYDTQILPNFFYCRVNASDINFHRLRLFYSEKINACSFEFIVF